MKSGKYPKGVYEVIQQLNQQIQLQLLEEDRKRKEERLRQLELLSLEDFNNPAPIKLNGTNQSNKGRERQRKR